MLASVDTVISALADPVTWLPITMLNVVFCTLVLAAVGSSLRRRRELAYARAMATGYLPSTRGDLRRRKLETARRITLWTLTIAALTMAALAGYQMWQRSLAPSATGSAPVVEPAFVVPQPAALPPPPAVNPTPASVPTPIAPELLREAPANTPPPPSPVATAADDPAAAVNATPKPTAKKKKKRRRTRRTTRKRKSTAPAKRQDTFEDL